MSDLPQLASVAPPPAPYEPIAPLRWLYRRFFAHIAVDDSWSRNVRDAASRGVVVYVMRSLSVLDFLCLDFLLKRFGLPLIHFVNDLGLWILEPFGKGGRRLRLRRQIPEGKALRGTIREGVSSLLFLRKPPRFASGARRGEKLELDLIQELVETQREIHDTILLLPQTFVWSHRPGTRQQGLFDTLFGPTDWPGRLRVLGQFLLNYRNAKLRSGQAFDLKDFIERNPELSDHEVADKVRYALLRRMERERELVLGPQTKTSQRIQEELLRSPRVRQHIEAQARETGASVAKVERQARKELRKLCAKQSPFALAMAHRFLKWLWNRMYDGVTVNKDGLERVRDAARDGAVVFLPSHKSHIDYLVLSYVLYDNALNPPLIAAGENLSFWPLGPLLRRGGAFFIRRSFQGRKLYAALVDAYMRKLLLEGFPIEFFLEGGRSRTGKLLPPKFGLLSMVVEAALLLPTRKIQFVPVSIGYERIIEQRSYVHELEGGEKQSENVGDLLKTSQVLRSKWGRLYVQFGENIDFDEFVPDALPGRRRGEFDRSDLTERERRTVVQDLAHRVMYSINEVTVVTPAALVATALLTHRRRGVTRSVLIERCTAFLAVLMEEQARTAPQLSTLEGKLRVDTIDEALGLFLDARIIVEHTTGPEKIYTVPDEHRIELEYYQNTLIHFFVARALIAAAVMVERDRSIQIPELRDRVHQLTRLFRHEFTFRGDAEFNERFDEALESMAKADELERVGNRVRAPEGSRVALERYSELLKTFFESYLLALRGAAAVLDGPLSRKEWVKRCLNLGRQMYLAGEIERRESLSKERLQTALKSLRDYELIKVDNDVLERGDALTSLDDLRELEPKLSAFLRRA